MPGKVFVVGDKEQALAKLKNALPPDYELTQAESEDALARELTAVSGAMSGEREYQSIIASSSPGSAMIVRASDGEMLYVSGTLMSDLGYTDEEFEDLLKDCSRGFVHPADFGTAFRPACEREKEGVSSFEQEYRAVRKDGSTCWIHESGTRITLSSGEAAYVIVGTDVNERKEMEERLRLNDEELKLAMSHMGKMICGYDLQAGTLTLPEVYAKRLGLPVVVTDIRSLHGAGFDSESGKKSLSELFAAINSGERTGSFEGSAPDGNGGERWERAEFFTIFDFTGEPARAIITIEDTTLEHHKEAMARQARENERVWQLVAAHSNRILYRYDLATKTAYADSSEATEKGRKAESVLEPEEDIRSGLILPDSAEDYRRVFREIHEGKQNGGARLHVRGRDGERRWMDMKYSLVRTEDAPPRSAVISFLDITEDHEKELAYDRYLQNINKNSGSAGFIFFEADLTLDLSEKFGGLALPEEMRSEHCSRVELIEHILRRYVSREDRPRFREFFSREHLITKFSDGARELREDWAVITPEGRPGYFRSEAQMVQDPYTGHIKVYTTVTDITAEKLTALKVREKAERDGATGVYNKYTAETLIKERLARADNSRCVLLIADIDDLKSINDNFGHSEGDKAILHMANVLRAQFRQSDVVGRVGGDEFIVFLVGDLSEEKLRLALSSFMRRLSDFHIGGKKEYELAASAGIVTGEVGSDTYEELFKKADKALYHAKRGGKNDFVLYTPEMEQKVYEYKGRARPCQRWTPLFENGELNRLMRSVTAVYSMVISADLRKNSYDMLKYDKYAVFGCPDSGSFDALVKAVAESFHPDDRETFLSEFSRESLMEARRRGETVVSVHGRQLEADGEYHATRMDAVFDQETERDEAVAMILAGEI